jgi:hypothetical protein
VFVIDQAHPEPCRFEPYDTQELIAQIEAFADRSGFRARDLAGRDDPPVSVAARLELFEMSPRDEQSRAVAKAQGYDDDRVEKIVNARIEGAMAFDRQSKGLSAFDSLERRTARETREAERLAAEKATKTGSRRK